MPSLSVDERASFDETQFVSVGYVYFSQPELVFEAPLNGAFYKAGAVVALDYGTPTTGAYTDIESEMTLEIWNADYNAYGSQRIRQAATVSAIYVGRSAQGNKTGELQIADSATIRVYKERKAWAKIPYISPNGKQFKDETAYPSNNAAQPPVSNAGEDVLIVVANNATGATIPLDALGNVPSFAVRNGASLSTYLWDLDDGSVNTGTLASSSLTADFPLGERYVSLTVIDSNGIAHTAYKYVVVATKAQCTPVKIGRETIRINGVSWQFTVNTSDLPSGIRTGTKILYTQHDDYSLNQVSVRFSGWLGTENYALKDAENQQKEITITCYDVAERLRQIHGFPLTVETASSSNGWYRMPNANIDRLTHHYLQWHTNVLSLADFAWSGQGATYPLPRFTTDGATIWEQGDRLARAIGYSLTCNSKGQIQVKGNPLILPTADQASTYNLPTQRTSTVVTTLTDNDYGEFDFDNAIAPSIHWLRGAAVVAANSANNIKAVKAAAPSKTPGQGKGTLEETEQLVTSQLEFNCRLANRYAALVNPSMGLLTLNMVKSRHILEPADMEWLTIIAPEHVQSKYPEFSETGERYIVNEITNTYNLDTLRKNTTYICQREFAGVVNNDMTIIDEPKPQSPSNPNNNYSTWEDTYVPVVPDVPLIQTIIGLPPIADEDGQGMVAFLSNGRIAVTSDFETPSYEGAPSWTVYDHSATIGSNVIQFVRKAGETDVTGWLVTDEKIFLVEDAQSATPTFTEQLDFGYASDYRNIAADALFAPGLFAVVASVNAGSVYETRTINGGTTWGGEIEKGTVPGGGDWCHEWSGSQFASDFTLTAGTNTAGGVTSAVYTPSGLSVREAADIYIDLGAEYNLTSIVLGGSINWGGGLSFTYSILEDLHPDSLVISRWTDGQTPNLNGDNTLIWTGSRTAQIIRVSIAACGGAACSGDSTITYVQISGTGVKPTFVSGDDCGMGGNDIMPSIHIGTEEAGYVVGGLGIPSGDTETPIYVASDYSFAYVEDTDIVDDDAMLTGLITRVGDDTTFFYGYYSSGESSIDAAYDDSNNLFRGDLTNGETDITPIVDSNRYGTDWLRSKDTIAISNTDILCFIGVDVGRANFGVFITNTPLAELVEWTQLLAPSASVEYRRVLFSANASSMIIFGENGAIAYSEDVLNPLGLDSRTGDLSTSAEIIGIASYTP